MAANKQLTAQHFRISEKVLKAYEGFANLIVARVENEGGPEVVLAFKPSHDLYWLKSSYKRLLNFYEQIHLKNITTKIGSDGTLPAPIQSVILKTSEAKQLTDNRVGSLQF